MGHTFDFGPNILCPKFNEINAKQNEENKCIETESIEPHEEPKHHKQINC